MHNATLLHSRSIPNEDGSVISPNDGAVANIALFSYGDISNYLCRGSHISTRSYSGLFVFEAINRHRKNPRFIWSNADTGAVPGAHAIVA
jgi:hypothetical protein